MDESKSVNIYVTQTFQGNVNGQVKGVEIGQLSAILGSPGASVVERRIPHVSAPKRQEDITLVGRDDVLQNAIDRLQRSGKFYFYGAYGVGKTTLASELFNRVIQEHEPADGYLWGSVADMSPEDALEWIAGALQEVAVSQASGQQAKVNLLRQAISLRKELLIGLDDVRDDEVARVLINASGDCPLILNGTRSLDLAGLAQTVELNPLDPKGARQLFTALAYPAGTRLSDRDLSLIDQIASRLGRLPLAIRLAARQRRQGVSLDRLLDMLEYAPGALISGESGLKAYLDNLLQELQAQPDRMQILLRLACFPAYHASIEPLYGGLSKRARYEAESFLVERGILERQEGDRLGMHALLALWIQNAEPEPFQAQNGLIEAWLVDYARQHRDDYDDLELEQSNLLGLLDRFKQGERWDELVDLLSDLFIYLRVRGLWGVNYHTLETALENLGAIREPHHIGWAYLHRGIMHTLRGEKAAAEADLDQADQVFIQTGNTPYRGKTLYRRAALTQMSGDLSGAAAQLEQALEWMSDIVSIHDRGGAHELLANVYSTLGRRDDAEAQYQNAIDLGDPEIQARAFIQLGSLARQSGDYEKAQSNYQQALRLAERLGHVLQRAILSQELGYLYYQQGSFELAERSFLDAGQIYSQLNFPLGLAHIQHALGNVAFARQDLESAQKSYQSALDLNRAQGVDANSAYNRYMLAVVAQRQGDIARAEEEYGEVLQAAQEMGDLGLQASVLYQSAGLAFDRGDRASALDRLKRAQELAKTTQDRQTEAASLALLGRLQAQEGQLEAARQTLASAHALFAAFNAVDAEKVAKIQDQLNQDNIPALSKPAQFNTNEVAGSDQVIPGGSVKGLDEIDRVVSGGQVSELDFSIPGGDEEDEDSLDSVDLDRIEEGGDIAGEAVDEE